MLQVAIIASGGEYQEAAAWAAATYVHQAASAPAVAVLLPEGDRPAAILRAHAKKFGFQTESFPFRRVSEHKFASQLKCQGFWFAVNRLAEGDLLFLVDADTCCLRPLKLSPRIQSAILRGKIGLAADIADHHFQSPAEPCYLGPKERTTYVNSGVILAGRKSRDMFRVFLELSAKPEFLQGPFNDQKVINYALGKYFRKRLVLLDPAFNGIHQDAANIIAHCAGGAGLLGLEQDWRKPMHLKLCAGVLAQNGAPKISKTKPGH